MTSCQSSEAPVGARVIGAELDQKVVGHRATHVHVDRGTRVAAEERWVGPWSIVHLHEVMISWALQREAREMELKKKMRLERPLREKMETLLQ